MTLEHAPRFVLRARRRKCVKKANTTEKYPPGNPIATKPFTPNKTFPIAAAVTPTQKSISLAPPNGKSLIYSDLEI